VPLLGVTIWAILAVLVDVSLARVAFGSVVPSLRIDLGIDFTGAGLVTSANAVGLLVTSAAAPFVAGKLGLRRMAIVGHLVGALGFALSALSTSLTALVVMRVVSGLGIGAGLVAALRIAVDRAKPEQRTAVSALAWSGGGLGLIAAALATPWLHDAFAWRGESWISAALAFVLAISAPRDRASQVESISPLPIVAPYRSQATGLILAAYLLFGIGFIAYTTFAAAETSVSPLVRFLSIGVAAIAGSLIAARVRKPERAMGGLMVLGAIGALFAIIGRPGGDILFGLGLTAVPGLATAILRSRASAAGATRAIALSVIAIGSGQVLGPLIAGEAAEHLGVAWAFGVAGAAYVAGVLLIVYDRLAAPPGAATV
jgi:MFS family permease